MGIQRVKCPSCNQVSDVVVPDYPTAEQIAEKIKLPAPLAPPADDSKAIAVAKELEDTEEALAASYQELKGWRSGENHANFDPDTAENCPNCAPRLKDYVEKKVSERLGSLNKAQVRELARKHGDWPPPAFEIGASSRSARP